MNGAADRDAFTNYFNYFTEIEDHFQRARGTSLFLLSPLDWALIESWKNSGVPLEAVLRGVDEAFEKWRAGKPRARMVNSLAYCTQAVMTAAERMAESSPRPASGLAAPGSERPAPFAAEELRRYIEDNAAAIRTAGVPEFLPVAEALERIASSPAVAAGDLEALERNLSILEEKLIAIARARQSEAQALEVRRELETQLRPWKGKMTVPQIAMLEAQYLDRAVLASAGLPRLSLFYLHAK
jgi:hypothetical protein